MTKALRISAVLLLCAGSLSAAPVPSAAAAKETASLRTIGAGEFIFYDFHDPLLYPETAVLLNPAVVAGFTHGLYNLVLDTPFTQQISTDIRADDSIGAKGGTLQTTNRTLFPDARFLCFFPLPGGTPPVLGFMADASMDYSLYATQKANYDLASQSESVTDLTLPFSASFGSIYALGQKGAALAFSGKYGLGIYPHAFRETSTVLGGTTTTTWSQALNPTDIYTHVLDAHAGIIFPLSRSTSLGIALGLEGGLRDASTAWRAVDTNGDGLGDALVTLNDWYLSTDAGGPTTPASSYARLDRTWSIRAALSLFLRIALTNELELFADGTWRGYDLDLRRWYEHILYPTATEDNSAATSYLFSGLTSGDVMVGVAIGRTTDSLLKLGAGYRRNDLRYSQDGVDAAGNNIYSYLNPNHFPEASLGVQPANGAAAQAVTALGLPPWTDTTNSLLLETGFEYRVGQRVRLFADAGVEGSRRIRQFWVFNLDTNTSWTESETQMGLEWSVHGAAGMAVELGKNGVLTIDFLGSSTQGSLSSSTETLPFDSILGQDTTNGALDLASSSPFNFRVHAGFTYTL